MRPLVTAEQMRSVEQSFVDGGGDLDWLMLQAGMQVAARIPAGRPVLFLVGPGNNGGDALIAASVVEERGDTAKAYLYKRSEGPDGSIKAGEDGDCSKLRQELDRSAVVVDGLLGIGRKRPVDGQLSQIIDAANDSACRRIAVDIPTGIDTDTGSVETVAFRADTTVTVGLAKRGLWGSPAFEHAGSVEVADIGLPPGSVSDSGCVLLDDDDIRPLLPDRGLDWNKGKSGRVLVIAGSDDYTGAPSLVATAAYRAGAGLVDLAVPTAIKAVVSAHGLESVFTSVPSTRHFTPESIGTVIQAGGHAKAVALGPGLGPAEETVRFVREFLLQMGRSDAPLVLDADGLNAVAGLREWWIRAPREMVLTPHPGEMARLLHRSVADVQADRFGAVSEAVKTWDRVVVLKGANTIVGAPGEPLRVCPVGGPNLATAGTGDVLTGIISGYLAQGLNPVDAATAGVWVHGLAGRELQQTLGRTGTLASDLWSMIPRVRRKLLQPLGRD